VEPHTIVGRRAQSAHDTIDPLTNHLLLATPHAHGDDAEVEVLFFLGASARDGVLRVGPRGAAGSERCYAARSRIRSCYRGVARRRLVDGGAHAHHLDDYCSRRWSTMVDEELRGSRNMSRPSPTRVNPKLGT